MIIFGEEIYGCGVGWIGGPCSPLKAATTSPPVKDVVSRTQLSTHNPEVDFPRGGTWETLTKFPPLKRVSAAVEAKISEWRCGERSIHGARVHHESITGPKKPISTADGIKYCLEWTLLYLLCDVESHLFWHGESQWIYGATSSDRVTRYTNVVSMN